MTATTTTEALRDLAATYAAGVDRRDAALIEQVFHDDATLIVRGRTGRRPDPERRREGRAAIGGIAELIARYDETFHFVGQARYAIGADDGTAPSTATGEVYCEAHHLLVDDDGVGTDHVLFIRYQDDYRTDDDGAWRIATRIVQVDWSEDRSLSPTTT